MLDTVVLALELTGVISVRLEFKFHQGTCCFLVTLIC